MLFSANTDACAGQSTGKRISKTESAYLESYESYSIIRCKWILAVGDHLNIALRTSRLSSALNRGDAVQGSITLCITHIVSAGYCYIKLLCNLYLPLVNN